MHHLQLFPEPLKMSTQNTQPVEEEHSTPLRLASPSECFGPSSRYLGKKGNKSLIHHSLAIQESPSSDKLSDEKIPQHKNSANLGCIGELEYSGSSILAETSTTTSTKSQNIFSRRGELLKRKCMTSFFSFQNR
ncbi:hypothetical protein GBA52_008890 [Prunus armeniaca]|nr:hypothetical protein GBA52_008890 [Prunus armeniaca]